MTITPVYDFDAVGETVDDRSTSSLHTEKMMALLGQWHRARQGLWRRWGKARTAQIDQIDRLSQQIYAAHPKAEGAAGRRLTPLQIEFLRAIAEYDRDRRWMKKYLPRELLTVGLVWRRALEFVHLR
jgi:hypothetical protein